MIELFSSYSDSPKIGFVKDGSAQVSSVESSPSMDDYINDGSTDDYR